MMDNQEIMTTFIKLVNTIQNQNKNKVCSFGNVKIFPSEAHLILFIHEEQEKNVTNIAEKLGITKGAVSMTLSRLKRKGLITTQKDKFNKNELTISFNQNGIKVLEHLLGIKAILENHIEQIVSQYNEREKKLLLEFLSKMKNFIEE